MKKFLIAIVVGVLVLLATSHAGQLSVSQAAGPYKWERIDTITAVKSVTGTDSVVVFTYTPVKWGYGYAMAVYDSIVSDSVAIQVKTYVKKYGGQYGYYVADNVSSGDATNPYVVVDLGVGTSTIGDFFTVSMKGLNATTVKKIKRAALYRYKIWETTMPYNASE